MSDAIADFVKLDIFGVVHLAVSVAADLSVLHGFFLLVVLPFPAVQNAQPALLTNTPHSHLLPVFERGVVV